MSDLQSEFQLDRADYLETIRRLDKNLKFYQQLIDKALPVLRRDGRFWDVDAIKADAVWNEDLEKWKLPENSMMKLILPPAGKIIHFILSSTPTFNKFIKTYFHYDNHKKHPHYSNFQFDNTFIPKWIQINKMVTSKVRH